MSDTQIKAAELKAAMEEYENIIESLGMTMEGFESLSGTIESSFEDVFMSMIDGTKSAKDAFRAMATDIIKELFRVLVVQQLVGSFQSGKGILGLIGGAMGIPTMPGRASGGTVQAGSPYIVGEHGREPFVPEQNGRILSVAQAKSAVAGGDGAPVIVNQTINVSAGVSQTVRAEMIALQPLLSQRLIADIEDAKRRSTGAF